MAVTVLGTLGVVLIVNVAATGYLSRFEPNRGYAAIAQKWRAVADGPRVDWWILGDSVADQSIVPGALAAALPGAAYSYATTGNAGLANSAWMLERLIARHGPPRGVILAHAYDVWRRPTALGALARVPSPWGFWERSVPPVPLGGAEKLEVFLHRYAPLISRDGTLAYLLTHPRAWFQPAPGHGPDGRRVVTEADPGNVRLDLKSHLTTLATEPDFLPHAQAVAALDAMRALAQHHGFPLIVVGPAVYEALAAAPSFRRYYAGLRRWLQGIASADTAVHFLLPEPVAYPADQMDNADHLIAEAARDFTRRLVGALRRAPGVAAQPGVGSGVTP